VNVQAAHFDFERPASLAVLTALLDKLSAVP